jgi:hypothetical protein
MSPGDGIPTIAELWAFMGYLLGMCSTALSVSRKPHQVEGIKGGLQGDPLEMLVYGMTVRRV